MRCTNYCTKVYSTTETSMLYITAFFAINNDADQMETSTDSIHNEFYPYPWFASYTSTFAMKPEDFVELRQYRFLLVAQTRYMHGMKWCRITACCIAMLVHVYRNNCREQCNYQYRIVIAWLSLCVLSVSGVKNFLTPVTAGWTS